MFFFNLPQGLPWRSNLASPISTWQPAMPPEMAPARISSSKSSQQTISSRHSPVNDELTISEEHVWVLRAGWESSPPSLHQTFNGPPSNMRAKPTHVDLAITFQVWWSKTSMNIYQSGLSFGFLHLKKPTTSKEMQRVSVRQIAIANRPESSRIIIACILRINWGAQLPNQLSSDMCSPLHGRVGYSVLCRCGLPIYQCCWTGGEAGPTVKNSGFFDMSSLHVCFKHECTMLQNDMYTAFFKTNWNPYCKNHDIDRYLHLTFPRSPYFPLGTEPEKNKLTKTQERCKSWTGLSRVKGHLFPQKKTLEKKTP